MMSKYVSTCVHAEYLCRVCIRYGNELRDRLARHGALETVTRAMGAHLVSSCAYTTMLSHMHYTRRRTSAHTD